MSLWNGNRGALTLTFDDALPSQLKNAVPAMTARELRGTFFAIANNAQFPLDVHGWRKAVAAHHEIGSHSVHHRKASNLTVADAEFETRESKRILENHFGTPVTSFCYPYTDAPAVLMTAVRNHYKQARGGRVARWDKYITPQSGVNLHNIPSFHINDGVFDHGVANALVDAALERGAWVTFMFHAIGDSNGWDNVSVPTFEKFLDHLAERVKNGGLWVPTFAEAADSLRENTRA